MTKTTLQIVFLLFPPKMLLVQDGENCGDAGAHIYGSQLAPARHWSF
jgi:hypothetical protein